MGRYQIGDLIDVDRRIGVAAQNAHHLVHTIIGNKGKGCRFTSRYGEAISTVRTNLNAFNSDGAS